VSDADDPAKREKAEAAQLARAGYATSELERMAGHALGFALRLRADGQGRAWLDWGNGLEFPLDVPIAVARRNLLQFSRTLGKAAELRGRRADRDQLAFRFMAEVPEKRRPKRG